eukprot:m.232352 g.232352  ORF g.232352 m.232352 type:complete len:470 (-) comp26484_c0_seq2:30-1439(-)
MGCRLVWIRFLPQKAGLLRTHIVSGRFDFVGMHDGYYIAGLPENRDILNSVLRVDTARVRKTCPLSTLLRINTIQRAILQAQATKRAATERLKTCLDARGGADDLLRRCERLRIRLNMLRQEHVVQRAELHQSRDAKRSLRKRLDERSIRLQQAQESLRARKEELAVSRRKLHQRAQASREALTMVAVRQTRIILEIYSIYPIQPVSSLASRCTICGIELPNSDFSNCDDDAVATALGYVCHLVFMVAKYLTVPLRYPLKPMCSKSTVLDGISSHIPEKDKEFPLFPKVKEKYNFEYGVFLLNKNIQQLMHHCSLGGGDSRNTLPNLRTLMLHFSKLDKQYQEAHPPILGPRQSRSMSNASNSSYRRNLKPQHRQHQFPQHQHSHRSISPALAAADNNSNNHHNSRDNTVPILVSPGTPPTQQRSNGYNLGPPSYNTSEAQNLRRHTANGGTTRQQSSTPQAEQKVGSV